jgi:6-phosphogluconolactonase
MSDWKTFGTAGELDRALAVHIAEGLRRDIDSRGSASLAVSGGSTPKHMFELLSACELDWSRVWITLVDERWVSTSSEDSNERLLRESLLQHSAAAAQFVGLKSGHEDARDAIAEITGRLKAIPRPLTTVVLGMGGDGHTASWFPMAANLRELLDAGNTNLVAASDPVTAAHQRMTLTLATVLDCLEIAVHITGEEKRSVLENAGREGYPIAAVLEQHTTPATIWWAP